MRKLSLTFAVLFLVSGVRAQLEQSSLQDHLQDLLEQVYEEDPEINVEQTMSDLVHLEENPIGINQAVAADFEPLFFLSPLQVEELIKYRDQFGPLLSLYEIATIEGFTPELAQLTASFLHFDTDLTLEKRRKTKQEMMIRGTLLLEEQAGFVNGKFEGSPEKLYLRYRFSSDAIQLGYTAEKDAGESFFSRSNANGFDYNSGFVRFRFGRKTSGLILGDYVVQWGQGLTVWQGFAMGKSSDVDRISRFNQGIKAYSSTDENNYMRGIGADLHFGKFHFQPFISHKKFDANTDSIGELKVFTSFQNSGLHRATSEIDDKNSVAAFVCGAHISFQSGRMAIGISGIHHQYQFPLERTDDLYSRFLFEERKVNNLGLDYRYVINKVYFFGETATSFGALATLNGLMFQPVGQVSFSALYRNISIKYNSPAAAAFTENSKVNDEEGVFLGLRVFPVAKVRLNAYADFFQYKWIKYTTAAPGKGHEFMIRTDCDFSPNWQMYIRYFCESKPSKVSSEVIRYNMAQIRQGVRLQLNGELNSQFIIRSRFERSFYEHDQHSSGWMLCQDVSWQNIGRTSRFWFRLAYFKTKDYDSRIYSYENDLLYQFSIPAFYGEGFRSYINGKVKICEKIECWLKCARTWFLDVNALGSGNTAIDGSTRTEVKLQFRFRI